jgi:hypothetical protein
LSRVHSGCQALKKAQLSPEAEKIAQRELRRSAGSVRTVKLSFLLLFFLVRKIHSEIMNEYDTKLNMDGTKQMFEVRIIFQVVLRG